VSICYDLSKSPLDTNAKLKNQRTKLAQSLNKERQADVGFGVKSNLNDKEHFYCRPNVGETVGQYGT
jgi:hypothetical protein